MREKNVDKVIPKCPKYGFGYQEIRDLCRSCKKAEKCKEITMKARIAIDRGYKPDIPINKSKEQPMKVMVERPIVREGKLKLRFIISIDMDWFKKYLGSGKY